MNKKKSFKLSNMDAPCYKCKQRHKLCHDTCKKYIDYKKQLKEYIKNRKG